MNHLKTGICLLIGMLISLNGMTQTNGAEITYRCLDANGNYEVTLVYYRDCKGATLCAGSNCLAIGGCSKNIDIYGGDPAYINTKFTTMQVNGVSVRDVQSKAICADAKSICDNMGCVTPGIVDPAFERYEYKGTINLGASSGIPAACCNIRFTYTECCRPPNANSYNSSNSIYYTDAIVNRCAATYPTCNSPVFHNDPVHTILAGYPYYFNNGVVDPDQDSLVYSFTPSLQAYNTPVSYTPPYAYDLPMNYTTGLPVFPNGMNCNPVNGDIYFKPSSFPFHGTMAIRVDQYRRINNVITLVGVTRRDIVLKVLSNISNNQIVIRTNPAGNPTIQPKTSWEICAGQTLCFDIIAKDTDFNPPNISDTTYLTWDKSLEKYGATFTPKYSAPRDSSGPREDIYRFCWTPPDSVANRSNGQPFTFTVSAQDNHCPYPSFMTRAFHIQVFQRASVQIKQQMRDCNRWVLSYQKDSGTIPVQQFSSVQWKIAKDTGDWNFTAGATVINNLQQTPDIFFENKGRYLVELSIQMAGPSGTFCMRTFYDTVHVLKSTLVRSSKDTLFCRMGQSVTVSVLQTDSTIDQYRWYALPDTTNVLVTLNQFTTQANKTVSYLLRGIDVQTGCIFSDTTHIRVSGLRATYTANQTQQCFNGNKFTLSNQSVDSAGGSFTSFWRFSDGDSSNAAATLQKSFANPGTFGLKLVIRSAFNCSDSLTGNLTVNASPKAGFSVSSDSVQCQKNNNFLFNNQTTSNDGVVYTWDLGNGQFSNDANPQPVSYSSSGIKSILLIATTTTHACQDSFKRNVLVNPSPNVGFAVNNPSQCIQGNQFSFTNFSSITSGTITQQWYFGDGTFNTQPSPTYSYSNSGTYSIRLKVTSNLGCIDSMNQPIEVFPSPTASFQSNGLIKCLGDTSVFTNTSQISSGTLTYNWDLGNGETSTDKDASTLYMQSGQYTVELKTISDHACRDSAQLQILVNEKPALPVISGDTMVIRHSFETYSVQDHSGSVYTWIVSGDSSKQINGNSIIIGWGPSDGGTIMVVENSSLGCASDTGKLSVKVVPKTGLTPADLYRNLFIYPQPVSDHLFLEGETSSLEEIRLMNAEGQLIRTFRHEEIKNARLTVTGIESGVYFLMIQTRDFTQVRKISIIR